MAEQLAEHPVFEYREPVAPEVPLIVSSPHTGTYVPAAVAKKFASRHMAELPMTDWHLEHLYGFVPGLGAHFMRASVSRFVIDLNRAPDSRPLYTGRFETSLVATRTFQGDRIFRRNPGVREIEDRKAKYFTPYHKMLGKLIEGVRSRFGKAFLIDAHSVASHASLLHKRLESEIYLGNRDGVTSEPWMIEWLRDSFESAGLKVSVNDPYKGGYITDHYGRLPEVEAVQLEMCQRVYMDEDQPMSGVDHPNFKATSARLEGILAGLIREIKSRINGQN